MLFVPKTDIIYRMDKTNEPVLRAVSGDRIRFETCDCFTDVIRSESDLVVDIDFERINPATGPVYIEGAEPGDVLKVTVESIEVGPQGTMVVAPGFGLLGDHVKEVQTKIFRAEDGKVHGFPEPLPLQAMIGVIGTAPAGESVETGTPGAHGGNMDCRLIREGAVLYLPVAVPGALLAMGDLHAAMGDGEISVSGVEVAGTVQVHVEVCKNSRIPTPAVETKEVFAAIVSADTMEKASQEATLAMIEYLQHETELTFNEAYMLLSATGKLAVCQVVDPQVTMRMELPKSVLEPLRK